MYKCIIVDDEPHAIEGLKKYISSVPELEILQTYVEPLHALFEISSGASVDLIFLDVDMPGISGVEIARAIRQKTKKLIFTTAHTKYGYDAFDAGVDAFLLKPYSLGKFMVTYNKLFRDPDAATVQRNSTDFLLIKSKEDNLKLIKIRIKDIVAVESKLNYIQLHTITGQTTTYISLTEFSRVLMQFEGFHQFQRSFIIAQDYIEYVDGNIIKMVNGTRVSVGALYRKKFNAFVETKFVRSRRKS